MKIVLVPALNFENLLPRPQIPLGILRLATIAIQQGCDPIILDPYNLTAVKHAQSSKDIRRAIADTIVKHSPKLIGFSTTSESYKDTILIAEQCKTRMPNVPVIMGGPQASGTAEDTIAAFKWIDIIVKGEGEQVFTALLEQLKQNPTSMPKGVLDSACYPAVSLEYLCDVKFDVYPGWQKLKSFIDIPVEISRGCLHNCSFCYGPAFWNKTAERRSILATVREIDVLTSVYKTTSYKLVQDNFFENTKNLFEFCEQMKGRPSIKWRCMGSPDLFKTDVIQALSESGCHCLCLGMEHGNQKMRMQHTKSYDDVAVLKSISYAKSLGMDIFCSFIIGFPDETVEEIEQTFDLLYDCRINGAKHAGLHMLEIIAGSRIYNQYKEQLLFDSKMESGLPLDEESREIVINNPKIFPMYYYIENPVPRDVLRLLLKAANK